MSFLSYSCVFMHNGVQQIVCRVFLRLVYHMLPVSLDCPFCIAPLVFSNVYLLETTLYQGNDERNHKPWNVGSAERCILYMQVLTE
jgi:hypothetical protein